MVRWRSGTGGWRGGVKEGGGGRAARGLPTVVGEARQDRIARSTVALSLAAPPEPIDPRWLDVEAGRRYTEKTATERYPELNWHSFQDETLSFEIARRPKLGKGKYARNVKTYSAADIDAIAAERAKKRPRRSPSEPRPEPEPKEEEDDADGDDGECIIDARVSAWV